MTYIKEVAKKDVKPLFHTARQKVVSVVEDIRTAVDILDSIDINGGEILSLVNRQK